MHKSQLCDIAEEINWRSRLWNEITILVWNHNSKLFLLL